MRSGSTRSGGDRTSSVRPGGETPSKSSGRREGQQEAYWWSRVKRHRVGWRALPLHPGARATSATSRDQTRPGRVRPECADCSIVSPGTDWVRRHVDRSGGRRARRAALAASGAIARPANGGGCGATRSRVRRRGRLSPGGRLVRAGGRVLTDPAALAAAARRSRRRQPCDGRDVAWPRDRRRRLRRTQRARSDRVFILDGEQWRELHRLPEGRAAGGAAVVGDTLYVVGGIGPTGLARAALALDLRRDAWRQIPGPTPREHLAVTAAAGRVYALAGRTAGLDTNLRTLESWKPGTRRSNRLSPVPTSRGGTGATVIGRTIVSIGGEQPGGTISLSTRTTRERGTGAPAGPADATARARRRVAWTHGVRDRGRPAAGLDDERRRRVPDAALTRLLIATAIAR